MGNLIDGKSMKVTALSHNLGKGRQGGDQGACKVFGYLLGNVMEVGVHHENFKVALHPNFPDQEVAIGGTLFTKGRIELFSLLKENLDIFAWQPSDITGVPRSLAKHRLNIREGYSPVQQNKMARPQNAPRPCKQRCKMEGMFLGYMVTLEGIKPCPNKTKAVLQLPSPWTIKEVQSLNGKLASLNRFLSNETSFQATKAALVGITPAGSTQTKGGADCMPVRILRSYYVMLGEHNITYRQRTSVKGQVLADFLAEMSDESLQNAPAGETQQEPWTLFTDGSSCVDGSGVGLILTILKGTEFTYALIFQFAASNNEAEYEALIAEENMIKYLEKFKSLVSGITNFSINQVPRSKNKKADAMSKIASTSFAHLSKQVLVEILKEKSIQEKEVTNVVEEEEPTWMTPIMEYLKERTLPNDRKEARKLCIKAQQYDLLEGVLYMRSFLTPSLRCLGPLQAEYVIREIHQGSCSMHVEPRSVVAKAIRLGYYWPTMHRDARDMIREIVSNNGKQFSDNPFKDWRDKLNITQRFALVKHPQSNGLVERANRSLGEGIKARLGKGNKIWVEELPHVLWAHRTMIKSSHGDTPFLLIYGTEAVIPAKIGMPTYRTAAVDVVHNDEELRLNLDLLERRERAAIREAKAKLKMTKYYNARVRGVAFRPGDFVYRSNDASHAVDGGKLGPK
nr:hypothetical protein [Tanacetum cinerariifolium]